MTDYPATPLDTAASSLWATPLQPVGCPLCHTTYLTNPASANQRPPCPNCAQTRLDPQPARLRREPPERVLPFRISPGDAADALKNFISGVRFPTAQLNLKHLTDRLQRVYLPMWLLDADVVGNWEAEVGYDYQVKSSRESYSAGGWHTEEIIETRVRWQPRLGQIQRHYDNVPAPALTDHAILTQLLGQFQLDQSLPYHPDAVQQALIRIPDQSTEHSFDMARPGLHAAAAAECQQAASGQHIREYEVQAHYHNLNWTQLLLPVYATRYQDDDGLRHTVLINGYSGTVVGPRIASPKKGTRWAIILALLAAALFFFGLLVSVVGIVFPPIIILGLLCMPVALVQAIAALIVFFMPRNHNKQERQSVAYRRIPRPAK